MKFEPFSKIPRLSREMVVTEKLDGTSGQIFIEHSVVSGVEGSVAEVREFAVFAGSRNRYLQTGKGDNFGFAGWVQSHAEELVADLGPGRHFGEWWGCGIQRGYNLTERRFSLFNVKRWHFVNELPSEHKKCFSAVPILYRGPFCTAEVERWVTYLAEKGSVAAPGFMDPEGLVIFHTAANAIFKKTIKDDNRAKSEAENASL